MIHVYDNQFMMLVDGGKIIDYTAEPGYFTVDQSSSPSMFSGSLDAAVKDTFERLKFGGQDPRMSREFSILICRKSEEINSEREIRSTISTSSTMPSCSFGHTVPIPSRIVDPLRFYAEAVPRNASRVEIEDINEQYMNKF